MTALNIEYFSHFFQRGIKAARDAGDISQDDAIEGLRMWQEFVNRRLDDETDEILGSVQPHIDNLWFIGVGAGWATMARRVSEGVIVTRCYDDARQTLERLVFNEDEAHALRFALARMFK